MDREALILYLRNVRDLELAKVVMEQEYAKNQADYQLVQSKLHTKPEYWAQEESSGSGIGCLCVGGGIFCLGLSIIFFMVANAYDVNAMSVVAVLGVLCAIVCFVAMIAFNSSNKAEEKEKAEKIAAHNAEEDERAPLDEAEWNENKRAWDTYETRCSEDYRRLKEILDKFYNENLIPQEHRYKLANIQYLYETAKGTQLSYSDILLHGKLEEGIRRIEGKLNQLISIANNILYETHCLREEQNQAAQKQIEQNEAMLRQLESASASASEAAQYSRLAADYAEANAWFSLANYLK